MNITETPAQSPTAYTRLSIHLRGINNAMGNVEVSLTRTGRYVVRVSTQHEVRTSPILTRWYWTKGARKAYYRATEEEAVKTARKYAAKLAETIAAGAGSLAARGVG